MSTESEKDRRNTDDVISTREAAKLLGVSVRTVQLWVEGNALAAWKTAGGHRRVLKSSVERMLWQRIAQSSEESFRMLVVEDDPSLSRLYEMTIESWGLPVQLRMAKDGFEGMISLGSERPNLVILDLMMKGIDGFELVNRIRENPAMEGLKMMIVTALPKDDVESRGNLPQDVPVFTKPIPFGEIRSIVLDWLEVRRGEGK